MKALKGLLIYIGIILGIILGIGLILLCVMYFVPSVRIFGVGVVHYNKVVDDETLSMTDYSSYTDVELNVNSGNINISILPTTEKNLSYSLKLNIFGISSEIVEYRVTKNCVVTDDNILKINLNVTEPSGWISTNDSVLTVNIPNSKRYSLYTTSSSGDIDIGKAGTSVSIYGINVSTVKGGLTITNLGNGTDTKTLNLKSLNLTTDDGFFDFSNISQITVEDRVKLIANDGRFKFDNIQASLDISGNGVRLDANSVSCGVQGLNAILKNGYFNISTLSCSGGGENSIITDNTSFNVNEISGRTGIVTTYGDIKINKLNGEDGYSVIENTNGRVTIGTAQHDIVIRTTMGDITVENYYKSGTFSSKKGNIKVNSRSEYYKGCATDISNEDGKVEVYNYTNRLTINTTGKSRVEVTFGKIQSGFDSVTDTYQHQIRIKGQGSGLVQIPTLNTVPFMFMANNGVTGELAGFNDGKTQITDSVYEQYYPSQDSASDSRYNVSFLFDGKIELNGYSES